jgi:hypothetical protein
MPVWLVILLGIAAQVVGSVGKARLYEKRKQ